MDHDSHIQSARAAVIGVLFLVTAIPAVSGQRSATLFGSKTSGSRITIRESKDLSTARSTSARRLPDVSVSDQPWFVEGRQLLAELGAAEVRLERFNVQPAVYQLVCKMSDGNDGQSVAPVVAMSCSPEQALKQVVSEIQGNSLQENAIADVSRRPDRSSGPLPPLPREARVRHPEGRHGPARN